MKRSDTPRVAEGPSAAEMGVGADAFTLNERRSIWGVFATLINAGREKGVNKAAALRELGDSLALTEKQRERMVKLVEGKVDPLPFAAQLRNSTAGGMVLNDLLTVSLSRGLYDARDRDAIRRMAVALGVPWSDFSATEQAIAYTYRMIKENPEAVERAKRGSGAPGTWWKVAGATALGAVVIGATGGAAAPVVGGWVGSYFLGLSGAAAVSAGLATLGFGSLATGGLGMAGGTAVIAGISAVLGGSKTAQIASRRFGTLKDFGLEKCRNDGLMAVIGVSGFLSKRSDSASDWEVVGKVAPHAAVYSLQWDSESRVAIGSVFVRPAFRGLGGRQFVAGARKGIGTAGRRMVPPMLAYELMGLIDNPWHRASSSADKAGKALAMLLRARAIGARPVTLVGFSLGAKVVFRCLEELAAEGGEGLVHDAIILGGAFNADRNRWRVASRIVAGRLVNAYCTTDVVLSMLFRVANLQSNAAGLGPVDVDGVEDVDITAIASGHLRYRPQMENLLTRIGVDSPYRLAPQPIFSA